MASFMNLLTVITYLHPKEKNIHRCIGGLKQQKIDFEWIILGYKQPQDIGQPFTFNKLPKSITNKAQAYNYILPQIKSKFIAFNDADDHSLKNRFKKQLDFFESNPKIAILGGGLLLNGQKADWPIYENHDDISAFMIINNPIVNSSVMLRNTEIKWGVDIKYDGKLDQAEDYDFWLRCWKGNLTFSNLPEPLIDYYHSYDVKPTEELFARKIREEALDFMLPSKLDSSTLNEYHLYAEKKLSTQKNHQKIIQKILELNPRSEIQRVIRGHQFQKLSIIGRIKRKFSF